MNRKCIAIVVLFVAVLVILVVITVVLSKDAGKGHTAKAAAAAFKSGGIVPDVLDSVPDSLGIANVTYANDIILDAVNGRQLTPEETSEQPVNVTWSSCQQDKLYTLMMTDPDAPDPEKPDKREYRHWLVVNIANCDINNSGQTPTDTEYTGPSPPIGIHRYVFLIYEQEKDVAEGDLTNDLVGERPNWKAQKLAQALNFTLIAGNYFKAEKTAVVE